MGEKYVLLVYAGPRTSLPKIPMSVVVLASYLRGHGFAAKILDTRVEGYEDLDLQDVLCVGISSMSGLQLKHSLEVARAIRQADPSLPLIWGGVHPSFFPEQTARSKYVDVVVRGEGEESLLEVVRAIESGASLERACPEPVLSGVEGLVEGIKGITYSTDGLTVSNPDREFMDLDRLSLPAYDLLALDKYADLLDTFSYESSRGCPFRCKFCYNQNFHKRRWRAKSIEKVLNELETIVGRYHPRRILFIEDLFPVSRRRTLEICRGLIERDMGVGWASYFRADQLSRYSDDDVALLKESGCYELSIGVESGSLRTLKIIGKDITPEQVIVSVRKCLKYDIMPVMSFIIGFPLEMPEDMYRTLDFYDQLMALGDKVEINGLFVYSPYPGTPMYELAVEHGYQPFDSLEGWSEWNFDDLANTPWCEGKYREQLDAISTIARFRYFRHRLGLYPSQFRRGRLASGLNRFLYALAGPVFGWLADFRWKHRFFSFPWEWRLWRKVVEQRFKVR
jgi:anaerobic magnesium-protoporphyrin IX monomethyl ester cyclase